MKIVFPYIAQCHQIPHSLPIALELAARHPDWDIRVASISQPHADFISRLIDEYSPGSSIRQDRLRLDLLSRLRRYFDHPAIKALVLFANRAYFNQFDAIVTPERTSLLMRSIGVSHPRMIWTRHGAGDRSVGFAKNVRTFDYVLVAGKRVESRLLKDGLIEPGRYTTGVYAKFDWLQPQARQQPRLFDNSRPTVLYNPHFSASLSSWQPLGMKVLEQFANSDRYNLIFAPHIRLFDPPSPARYAAFERYRGLSNIHIDLGSERSIDMSYTAAADLYLGDVSSQVVEFLYRPRPCLFLNSRKLKWQGNPNYGFWSLGPVTETVNHLDAQIDQAIARHAEFLTLQEAYFQDSFDMPAGQRSASIGAEAIGNFLRESIVRREHGAAEIMLPEAGLSSGA